MNYYELTNSWENILQRMKEMGGTVRELIIKPPLSLQEADELEQRLVMGLPASYRRCWSQKEEVHQATVIQALERFLRSKKKVENTPYDSEPITIAAVPDKAEVVTLLENLKERQLLKKRILIIDSVLENLETLYS